MMKYIFLTLSVVFLFVACSKNTTPSLTRADMLRTGKWSMASGTISVKLPSGIKDTTFNYFDYMPSCHHDDYLTFNSATDGAIHSNGTLCSPHDPDSVTFQWALTNNNNDISFYRGFSLVWSILETVQPYQFDTLQQNPYLILDTIHGVLDTAAGFTRSVIILDTIWKIHFDSLYVPTYDIYNASITSFNENSFSIYFTMLSTYPDTNNYHTGTPPPNYPPTIKQDTVKYTLTFNKG